MRTHTRGARRLALFLLTLATAATAAFLLPAMARAAGNAGYTTFDATLQGCDNGSGNGVNCNIYAAKDRVFMNGGPAGGNGLDAGDYYFTVLAPGSQNGGFVDGADGNLSSGLCGGGTADDRSFHENADGTITNTGTHADGTAPNGHAIIQLALYCNTPNPGGVYIMAICEEGATSPSQCKYDAFKIRAGEGPCTTDCGPPPAADLTGSKTALPGFSREYNWTITKGVDACRVTLTTPNGCNVTSASKTLNYTVSVGHGAGSDSGWTVSGNITVTNPAQGAASGVTVSDATNVGGTCTVHTDTNHGLVGLDPGGDTLVAGDTAIYPYDCTFTSNPGSGINTASVSWNPTLDDASVTPDSSFEAHRAFAFGDPDAVVHNCVDVTDTYPSPGGTALGSVCVGDTNPTAFLYSRTVVVPHGCVTVSNTATFTVQDADTDADDTSNASVTAKVCRVAARTGALTIGFWQNKNGQGIIGSWSGVNCQTLKTWLAAYNPFNEAALTGATNCTGVKSYVFNVIKAAVCTSTTKTCNLMLKAQMLATALDVYFGGGPGGNRIGAPAAIGGLTIDLTQICAMIDSGGVGTCSGAYENVSSAFGGATSLTVSQMLAYAASQSNAGGTAWYAQVKATQVLAKDAFDAI
ncbi:MAG: hypothetical protein QOE29_204, partial [Gaiellaceae bacterium]|nr:hypothetical protein [Gaiellaceae bacterium]